MADKNKITFSGKISALREIQTKTGSTMSTMLLQVGRDKFKVISFGSVAKAILQLQDGDQVEASGTGSINSWQDQEGTWKNDFQLSAWKVVIGEETTNYQRPKKDPDQDQPNTNQTNRLEPSLEELEAALGTDAPF